MQYDAIDLLAMLATIILGAELLTYGTTSAIADGLGYGWL